MLLSVITFGLLGFASMPKHGHVPKDVASKPEGKCACGTYPLYLTEAEAGNSMCHVFSGTDYYMAAGGTHGGTCPAGMTDIGADCSGGMVMCSPM